MPIVLSYISEFFTEKLRGPAVIALWQPGVICAGEVLTLIISICMHACMHALLKMRCFCNDPGEQYYYVSMVTVWITIIAP